MAEQSEISRRDFFDEIVAAAFGIGGIGALAVTYQYLSPNALFEPPLKFRAGAPEMYPVNSVTYITDQQVYIVHSKDGFYAVSSVCTHLGCITKWNPDDNAIECPCHGSRFDSNGAKIEGPAPAPLILWEIALTPAGDLSIDKTEPLRNREALKV